MFPDEIAREQLEVCERYHVKPYPSLVGHKVGVSRNVRNGLQPINGLRHRPEGDTTGWYIWAGNEISDAPDFFVPLHVEHVIEWCPQAVPYLQLPPGCRFLVAPDHEDVWEDSSLLTT